jgi:hypothetical protein
MLARLAEAVPGLTVAPDRHAVALAVVEAPAMPLATVTLTEPTNPRLDADSDGRINGVPVPPDARPGPPPGRFLLLVDPTLEVSWDLAGAARTGNGGWQAAALDIWDLSGMGLRRPFTGPGWETYGARGSGAPLIAGLLRPEPVRKGVIRQALAFVSPLARQTTRPGGPPTVCPPASRTDGAVTGPDTLPMGVRLQLDPALDLAPFGLSREARVVARALQDYGMIQVDGSTDTLALVVQVPGLAGPAGEAGADVWADLDFSGLARLPLSRFRVLDCPLAAPP